MLECQGISIKGRAYNSERRKEGTLMHPELYKNKIIIIII